MTPVIVFFSRHPLLPAQRDELLRLFPGARILLDQQVFHDAADIAARFRRLHGDEMLIVAPLSVLDALCKQGIYPIRAVMTPIERLPSGEWPDNWDPHTDVSVPDRHHGRRYRFSHFEKVLEMRLITERLEPKAVTDAAGN